MLWVMKNPEYRTSHQLSIEHVAPSPGGENWPFCVQRATVNRAYKLSSAQLRRGMVSPGLLSRHAGLGSVTGSTHILLPNDTRRARLALLRGGALPGRGMDSDDGGGGGGGSGGGSGGGRPWRRPLMHTGAQRWRAPDHPPPTQNAEGG